MREITMWEDMTVQYIVLRGNERSGVQERESTMHMPLNDMPLNDMTLNDIPLK